jgi:hypothetical protein
MYLNKGMPRSSLVGPAPPGVIVTPGAKPTHLGMGMPIATMVSSQVLGAFPPVPLPIVVSPAINYLNCAMPVGVTCSVSPGGVAGGRGF